jgi:hypothetical protein
LGNPPDEFPCIEPSDWALPPSWRDSAPEQKVFFLGAGSHMCVWLGIRPLLEPRGHVLVHDSTLLGPLAALVGDPGTTLSSQPPHAAPLRRASIGCGHLILPGSPQASHFPLSVLADHTVLPRAGVGAFFPNSHPWRKIGLTHCQDESALVLRRASCVLKNPCGQGHGWWYRYLNYHYVCGIRPRQRCRLFARCATSWCPE